MQVRNLEIGAALISPPGGKVGTNKDLRHAVTSVSILL